MGTLFITSLKRHGLAFRAPVTQSNCAGEMYCASGVRRLSGTRSLRQSSTKTSTVSPQR